MQHHSATKSDREERKSLFRLKWVSSEIMNMSLRKTKSRTKRATLIQRRRRWQIIVFKSGTHSVNEFVLFCRRPMELFLPFYFTVLIVSPHTHTLFDYLLCTSVFSSSSHHIYPVLRALNSLFLLSLFFLSPSFSPCTLNSSFSLFCLLASNGGIIRYLSIYSLRMRRWRQTVYLDSSGCVLSQSNNWRVSQNTWIKLWVAHSEVSLPQKELTQVLVKFTNGWINRQWRKVKNKTQSTFVYLQQDMTLLSLLRFLLVIDA